MQYVPPKEGLFNPAALKKDKPEPQQEYVPPSDGTLFQPGKKPAPAMIATDKGQSDDPRGGPVKAWSASSLKLFESCAYRVFLKQVKRVPEPQSEAANRGELIHKLAEDYVQGLLEKLPPELIRFKTRFEGLREAYANAEVSIEGEWGFDINWRPTGWRDKDTWARMKLDAFHQQDETSALVIDHKTGKKFGNEIVHQGQAMIYAIGAFQRYPELEFVKTEFWYLDKGLTLDGSYTRAQAMALLPRLQQRAEKMTRALEFPPKPSIDNCRFCHYAKSGDCEWGYV